MRCLLGLPRQWTDLPGVIAAVALLLSRDTGYERRRNVYWNLLRNEVGEGYMSLHYIYIYTHVYTCTYVTTFLYVYILIYYVRTCVYTGTMYIDLFTF